MSTHPVGLSLQGADTRVDLVSFARVPSDDMREIGNMDSSLVAGTIHLLPKGDTRFLTKSGFISLSSINVVPPIAGQCSLSVTSALYLSLFEFL